MQSSQKILMVDGLMENKIQELNLNLQGKRLKQKLKMMQG